VGGGSVRFLRENAFYLPQDRNSATEGVGPMQAARVLFVMGLAVTTVSCGSDLPSEPGPNSDLECRVRGYPCSLSEVPLAVLERGDALGDEALARLEGGAQTGEAAAWLDAQTDVADLAWDETAIWFRVDGGAGIWILREGAFSPESRPGVAPAGQPAPQSRPSRHIVGSADSEEKKALVLSPFHWQVPALDDSPSVNAILSGTRGYENRVRYLANNQQSESNVDLSSFTAWDEYQVVHLSTHGKRICYEGACKATLVAGLLETLLPAGPGTKAEKLHALSFQGVTYAKGEKTGLEYLVLNADFFRYHYPAGLDNTLIFFNACQSFGPQATDLVDAIKGSTSVVFGWTETVYVADATATAVALYESLSERGYPAEVAYDKLAELKVGEAVPGQSAPELRVSERSEGGDLRIREVVHLLHPSSGQILTASDRVPIQGTQGDAVPDAAPYLVRVDGVRQQLAADMTVHISIDGVEADPVPLTSGQKDDEDRWLVSGVMPLSYDLTEEKAVTFRAWTDLHSGGESEHATGATLTGEEPIMGSVWELEAVHTSGWSGGIPHTPYTATARLTLRFAPGQAPTEPHPRYVVTGGTVTYDYTHSYFDCTFSAPAITFDVTADVSQDSRLVFDVTTSPVRYSGVIYTQGPEFQVAEQCSGGDGSTRTHRATNTWLLVNQGESRTVSGDRRSITGTYRVESGVGFYIESRYTITRIQ
jgi:hypothetical protein